MKKAISIFLALLMLASSSGVAYAQHFCGGREMLAEITLGLKDLSCGMNMEELPAKAVQKITAEHHCCENFVTQVKTDSNFAKASFNFHINKVFAATFVSVFVLQQVESYTFKSPSYSAYNPPPLERDFNILYETFLI